MNQTDRSFNNQVYETGNILIVDDAPDNLHLLLELLTRQGHNVWPAPSGSIALQTLQRRQPDLVMLDIHMPSMDGFEVCEKMKENSLLSNIPIIFISALAENDYRMKAFQVGGVDYITKPFQADEVFVKITTHLILKKMEQQSENSHAK